jgi:hypothetical protein
MVRVRNQLSGDGGGGGRSGEGMFLHGDSVMLILELLQFF